MSNKLQELTEKLYTEGLSKGREEGDRILAEAREKAGEILADAKAEAAAIKENAEKEADALRAKVASDLKMASAQCLQATKKDIENVVVAKISSEEALSDASFLKEIISTVARKFSTEQSGDLNLVLPASLKDKLEPWVSTELAKALGCGVKADFTKKVAGGFTIGPADGSYFVNLTDESFSALIAEYLRPVTRKLLFGE